MNRMFPVLTALIFSATLLPIAPPCLAQPPVERGWLILQQGITEKNAEKHAHAVLALRLLPTNPKARLIAENALADQSPIVRGAAATALGSMGALSSLPKL